MYRTLLLVAKQRHRFTKFLVRTAYRWHQASINNLARMYD